MAAAGFSKHANSRATAPCPPTLIERLAGFTTDCRPADIPADVRGNREVACMSSCMSWLLRTQDTGMQINPCMQKSGTKANSETPRDRYVTHDEYKAVRQAAGKQVRLMMDLTYRTLQRPESDIIKWTPANVTRDAQGARVIRHRQHKTGFGCRSA